VEKGTPAAAPDGGEVVGEWRPSSAARITYATVAGICACIFGALTIGSAVTPLAGLAPAVVAVGVVPYAPLAWVAGRLTSGIWRSRVTIGSAEVVAVGPWKTQRFPLEHVERFEAGRYGTGSAAVHLIRTQAGRARSGFGPRGSTLLWATQRGRPYWNIANLVASLEPLAQEMNDALATARAASPARAPLPRSALPSS
jgi:hypothetical protein